MLTCKVLLKQENGNNRFYLVIVKKGDYSFFFTVVTPHFITWDQSDVRCYVHSRGECIYQTNRIVSLRIL